MNERVVAAALLQLLHYLQLLFSLHAHADRSHLRSPGAENKLYNVRVCKLRAKMQSSVGDSSPMGLKGGLAAFCWSMNDGINEIFNIFVFKSPEKLVCQ